MHGRCMQQTRLSVVMDCWVPARTGSDRLKPGARLESTWCKARELHIGQLEHRPTSEIAGAVAGAIETWVFAWELAGVAKGQATVGRRELGLRENQEREAGPGLVVSRKSGPAHEGWLHGSVLALREGGMSQLA